MKNRSIAMAAMLLGLGLSAGITHGQEGNHRHEHRELSRPEAGWRLDDRYHHDHYYPPRGYVLSVLPRGSIGIGFGGGNLFFHGGVWFQPVAGRFIVTLPPIGVVVPVLPPAYSSLWIGGVPYYYANGVYYAAAPGVGYRVVTSPTGAETAQPIQQAAPIPVLPEPIIYPRGGQTAAQTEADRQDCNRWATTQPSAMADAQVFQRAMAACMEGRGYAVR